MFLIEVLSNYFEYLNQYLPQSIPVKFSASILFLSYTLSREYQVMRNQYLRLLFTSENRLCTNLRLLEQ